MNIRKCKALTISKTQTAPSGGIHPDHFEILYLTEGRARFQWAGHACEREAPALFLIGPSTPHALESIDPEIRCCFLEIGDPDDPFWTASNIHRWNVLQSRMTNGSAPAYMSVVRQSLQFIHQLYVSGDATRDDILAQVSLLELRKVLKLLAHALDASSDGGNRRSGRKKRWNAQEAVDVLIDFMEWRYPEPLTLATLAELVHFNPSYLVRVFKAHTGRTPFEYLQSLRLQAALSYLKNSDLPLKTIVERTGFNSVHYFCRRFRQSYGDSPVRWRIRQRRLSDG